MPSSPDALGAMQTAFWLALAPLGVLKTQGLALSFAYQGGLYFCSNRQSSKVYADIFLIDRLKLSLKSKGEDLLCTKPQ